MIKVLIVDDDFMVAKVHAGFIQRTPGFAVAARRALRRWSPWWAWPTPVPRR